MEWRNRKWIVSRLQESVPVGPKDGAAHSGLSWDDAETIASWVEAARDRGPVLFVGAGWTRNAENGEQALLWAELAREFRNSLEHDIGKDPTVDPLWLAELFRQRFGEDALITLLRRSIPDDRLRPGPLHRALWGIPWRAILTVNYDTLLEKSVPSVQRVQVCIDDVDLVSSAARDAVELIHLHGVLDRPETIVLAFEDYRRYPEKHPGLLAKVRQLFLQHPVMFVGFGVTDPNFLQWAGWLSDVVGKAKNPWVNVSLDGPSGMSLGRYWGTRLHFVSVPELGRFRVLVPEVLRVIGEAIKDKERSEEVAWLRIRATASPKDAIQEIRDLLDIGERSGAEGADWDRFRLSLFNAAASHVLDLAGIDWFKPSPAEAQERASRGLVVEIDARPPGSRNPNDLLVDLLRRAFGPEWETWLKLLRPLFAPPVWSFTRVDLRKRRQSDLWNVSPVSLDGEAAPATPPEGPASGTGDPPLDSLRSGGPLAVTGTPQTAQDFRLCGYLAYQRGEWKEAAGHYRAAATASRVEGEPLRREWLTLRSLGACLDSLLFHGSTEDRERAGSELSALPERLRFIRESSALLPRDGSIDEFVDQEIGAERKVAQQLVEDLERDDVDGTTRLGDRYGPAIRWLDRLERAWLAPPLISDAANALGTLQWRFADISEALLTLARYGSKRLAIVVGVTSVDANVAPSLLNVLVGDLLRHGRWPGEWMARTEGLLHLVPTCTAEQLTEIGTFVEAARASLRAASMGVARGSSTQSVSGARTKLEDLETSRWAWLAPAQAIAAVDRWIDESHDVPSIVFLKARWFQKLETLPWKSWIESRDVTLDAVERTLVRIADGRLSQQSLGPDLDDVEPALDAILDIVRSTMMSPLGSTLHDRIEKLIARLPAEAHDAYAASLARIDDDSPRLAALVGSALDKVGTAKNDALRGALDTIAVAGDCADRLPEVVSVLARITEAIAKELLGTPHPIQGRWNALESGRLVAHVVSRLLVSDKIAAKEALVERASAIRKTLPSTSEYLTAIPREVLGDVYDDVRASITELLRAAGPLELLTRKRQQFTGLRGVVRGLVQLGTNAVSSEWLTNVCALAQSDDADLAQYAAWILGEWASRRAACEADDVVGLLIAPTLSTVAFDGRVRVRANGVRGLVVLERSSPSAASRKIIETHRADPRVAIVRALAGQGSI